MLIKIAAMEENGRPLLKLTLVRAYQEIDKNFFLKSDMNGRIFRFSTATLLPSGTDRRALGSLARVLRSIFAVRALSKRAC